MSNKYVLDPSGKIIINGKLENANEASEKILKNQNDFFQQRRQSTADEAFSPARVQLDFGALKGVDYAFNNVELTQFETLLTSETPDFPNPRDDQEGHVIFPRKKNNQLLVNSSFGADSDININYYTPYNSIFSRDGSNRRIYAEELEMLTGLDLNSLGLSASGIGSRDGFNSFNTDFTQIIFIFDFLIESLAYIGTYWAINYVNRKIKNKKNLKEYYNDTPIQYYFSKIINTRRFVETTDILKLFNYYVVGLDRFINTDPKSKSLRDFSNFDDPSRIKFFDIFRVAIRNLLSISKVGRNRMFLLIRKFQQESYWHTELLYKHKQDTSENDIDKFFIEFSNYYFKFIIERINIGYIVLNRTYIQKASAIGNFQSTRNWDSGVRAEEDNQVRIVDKNQNWTYHLFKENKSSKFKTSIISLPQLFLTDSSVNIDNENFATREKNNSRRLPQELVKKVEEYLDNEYMPFYLHDLRTNEIVSMHAFLDSISDSFSPEYTSNSGYGRIDDVKHYVKTTRNINITFSLVSMQEEDHDLMWYQINKIVSMVYPQWSAGIPATTGKFKDINGFTYPFTQVPTASPLIRLRVGDVLKSNYTKKNIERLHFKSDPSKTVNKTVTETRQQPVTEKYRELRYKSFFIGRVIKNKNKWEFEDALYPQQPSNAFINSLYYKLEDKKYYTIKEKENEYHEIQAENNKKYKVAPLPSSDCQNQVKLFVRNFTSTFYGNWDEFVYLTLYETKNINEGIVFAFNPNEQVVEKKITNKTKLISVTTTVKSTESLDDDEINNITNSELNKNINNPYTKAFETAGGKGLAGFITSLDVNYQDVTWETNHPGSNAPHSVKITMGFSPIHDIAPGLDHEGIMRAPIYNVGSLNKSLFGDVEFGDDE